MAVVTLPGSSGGIVTVQSGSGDHIFVAQIIANTILLASVGGSSGTNLNTPVAVAVDGGTPTTAPPASTDGLQNILYLTGTGGGSFDVPTGYNYVVDLMTGPETITGSNVQVEGYDSAGSNYVLTGNVSIAAANVTGPQNVSVLGTANIATGDGNDTINLTGAGTVDGGAGANVIDVAATAGGAGIRVQSEGTGDTVSANGAFGGATTVISSGDGASITDTGDGAFNAMLLAAAATLTGGTGLTDVTTAGSDALVIAGSGPLTEIDTGTGDSIFAGTAVTANVSTEGSGAFVAGSIGAFTATDTGTNDTIAAFGASPANVTAGGSDAMVFGGSGTFNVSVGGSGNSVVAGSGSTLATLGGTGSYLYSETSATTVQATGTNDTIVGGGGPLAVTASSSAFGLFVYTNGSPLNFVGDNGPVTIVGSSGAESIAGGAGGTTLFGGTGSNITYTGSLGNLVSRPGQVTKPSTRAVPALTISCMPGRFQEQPTS